MLLATDREQQWCQGRDLDGIRIRGMPLVNWDDKQELNKSPPSIALPIYTTELARYHMQLGTLILTVFPMSIC